MTTTIKEDNDLYQLKIAVKTNYIEAHSQPENDRYAFSYTISIKNTGKVAAKLLSRHWIVTDANNKVQEVRGEGVVGEQPHLQPGQSYQYTSGTLLETPVGTMEGSYYFIADDEQHFEASIAVFGLAVPGSLH